MKLNLNKIFNNIKSNNCAPREVVVTRNDIKNNNIKQEYDEVISLSSSDSDIFNNISIMSTSSTSEGPFDDEVYVYILLSVLKESLVLELVLELA